MKLTYSNVTASLALALSLGGGTAVAAQQLGRDSVGERELRAGAVRSAEIKNASVRLRDLASEARPPSNARLRTLVTDTMTSSDVLTALSGAVKGEKGAQGDAGPAGAPGQQGKPGIADVVIRQASSPVGAGRETVVVAARCEGSERALGGGGQLDRAGGLLSRSFPLEGRDGWAVAVTNDSGEASSITAYAICAVTG